MVTVSRDLRNVKWMMTHGQPPLFETRYSVYGMQWVPVLHICWFTILVKVNTADPTIVSLVTMALKHHSFAIKNFSQVTSCIVMICTRRKCAIIVLPKVTWLAANTSYGYVSPSSVSKDTPAVDCLTQCLYIQCKCTLIPCTIYLYTVCINCGIISYTGKMENAKTM